MQQFDRFRPYFSFFVGILPTVFIIPLTIRLYRYPSVLLAAFQLIWSIFRPIATVHTLTLGLNFVLANPRTVVRMKDSSLISFFALPVPISLFVTFHQMWLITGNGNPNYLFFQCFAFGLFVAVILLDVVSATVKRDKVRRMVAKDEFSERKYQNGNQTEKEVKNATNKIDGLSDNNGVKSEVPTTGPKVVFL